MVKIKSDGKILWKKAIGGTKDDAEAVKAILDQDNNILVMYLIFKRWRFGW